MDLQTTTQEPEADGLAEALSAAFDHIEAGGTAPDAPVLEIDTPEGQDPITNPGEPPAGARAEQATTGQDEARASAGDASARETENGQQVATQDAAQQTDDADRTTAAPSSWTRETAGKWADLPDDVKAEIHRRETDYHRGIEQYRQGAQALQEVQQVFAPYMQNFQAAGVHPLQGAAHLLGVENTLRNGSPQEKAQKVAEIIRDYGIDPATIQPLPALDPQTQQLMRQNQQLQNFQHITLQRQQQAVMNEIQAFGANPANAHFEAVKQDMAALLTSGQAQSLQDAYDKAVWMRPDIRQTLVNQQRTDASKQAAEQQRQARAKSAAGGVKGAANPKATTLSPDASLRDTLNAAFDGNL